MKKLFPRLLTFLALGLAACLSTAPTLTTPPPTATAEPTSTPLPPPTRDPSWPTLTTQLFVSGFNQPVHVVDPGDGSGRLFVVEQTGLIRIIHNGQILSTPFLDLSAKIICCEERGLLNIAFPPHYANHHFYIYYTSLTGDNVVARYRLTADPNVADPASEQIVLTLLHPIKKSHNGGQMLFGPNGYLYLGPGDGGGVGDELHNAQNPDKLLGKILRIDVETGAPLTYTIPASNPFTQTVGHRPEIWAWGLRNPWRFTFDRLTGELYIADAGQSAWEEINVQPADDPGGENYGWNCEEGLHDYQRGPSCPTDTIKPSFEFEHTAFGCALVGGYVYRGADYPRLQGIYLLADFCSGRIWGAQRRAGQWATYLLSDQDFSISSFGEDAAGELYVVDYSQGAIYKVQSE